MEDNTSRVRLLPVEEDASASYVSTSLPARVKQNLRCKRGWSEVSGSLGDLGTFVPIVIALTLVNGLDLGTTLIFTGVYNILTGLIWGIPMPVQPMKSIAAVAISEGEHLTIPQIMAAGICTAGTLFTLGVTGLMGVLYRWLPLPVVRGVQLSQGLSFAFTAVKYVRKNQNFVTGKSVGDRAWVGWDGLILALVGFCFIVMVTGSGDDRQENQVGDEDMDSDRDRRRSNRYLRTISGIPSALIVFLIGIIIGIWRQPEILKQLTLGPSKLHIISISKNDWKVGFLRAAIPQIPLSVLNSVIAVCKLSNDLFPLKEVTATSVSASVGVMNLVGCWFGAMPVCHGAGGLAGQYRFGARSGKKSELPPLVLQVQDMGVLVSRVRHGAHHRAPYDNNYCIVSGMWNPLLDKTRFFKKLEMFIYFRWGVRPRCWDETAAEWLQDGSYFGDGSNELL